MSKKIERQGAIALEVEGKGPWDAPDSANGDKPAAKPAKPATGSDPSGESEGRKPNRNPWAPDADNDAQQRGKQRGPSLEDLLRRAGSGGGGKGFSGLPTRPNGKSWLPIIIGGVLLLWIAFTSIHRLDQQEQGVVTFFGKYSRTESSGIAFTLPAPLERMEKVDTRQIRTTSVGSEKPNAENLVLTKDQNIVDMAYDIRWSIKSPELYLFQLDQPDDTVQQVGESAMRAVVANFNLGQAIGDGRSEIAEQVRRRMQSVLDEYRSGVRVEGISIRQSDPPSEVTEAFRQVTAAQQQRESYLNDARATASQINEQALGGATEFDKIYEQYRLAPEVTRRRLYYETMESVLSKVDKTVIEGGKVTPYLPLSELKKKADPKPADVAVTGKSQ